MTTRATQLVIVALAVGGSVIAQSIPKGFVVPECTLSRDGRYGVTVPILDERDHIKDPRNNVIEVKTGKVIAVIDAHTAWTHMAHGGVLPSRWSPDGSMLLWEVEGKWFPDALVLLKFSDGTLEWQTDILAAAQKESLSRTKSAAPEKYAEARKANAGNGSAYPEGFTIDVAAMDPIAFPLRVWAALTSNPKELEGFPQLESALRAVVNDHGQFVVTQFYAGSGYYELLMDQTDDRELCNFTASKKQENKKQ